MVRWFLIFVLVTLISGCGTNSNPNLSKPDGSGQVQISVDPKVDSVKSVGDIIVTVPAGTFSAPTSISIERHVAADVPKLSDFRTIGSEPQITISVPSVDLEGDIVIDLPMASFYSSTRQTSTSTTIYGLFAKLADGNWTMVSKLPQTEADYLKQGARIVIDRLAFSSFGKKITAVIGGIGWTKPENKRDLVLVHSDSTLKDGYDLVLVHGWNSTRHIFDRLIESVATTKQYANIYALEYNWCDYIEPSGVFLSSSLGNLVRQGRHLDIWSHSMGALVARYAMETCKATKNVRTFVSICGVNEGSVLGNIEKIMVYLRTDYLNKPEEARGGLYFPAFDTYSTSQVMPGSSFIQRLNSGTPGSQIGNVNYVMISGQDWTDLVAGRESGLASNTNKRQLTLGTISEVATYASHSSLLETKDGVEQIINSAKTTASSQLAVILSPDNVIEVDPSSTRWDWEISLRNQGDSEVIIKSITFDQYDGLGEWCSVSWYDPSVYDSPFPTSPVECDFSISGHGEKELSLTLATDREYDNVAISDLSPNFQTRVFVICVLFRDHSGSEFKINRTLVLKIPGLAPLAPKTRSRGIRSSSGLANLVLR